MGMEHRRPNGGLSQGYFCSRCGAAGMNMYGTGHGVGKCESNGKLVKQLMAANPSTRLDWHGRYSKKPHFVYEWKEL